jgi:putative membrane protein (TIGR04086 family)
MGKKIAENNRTGENVHVVAILQGLFITLVLIILISAVLTLLVYFSSWQINLRLLNLLAHSSVIGGAIWAGRRSERNAWLHGVVVGMLAFLFLTWMGDDQGLFATWLWWKRLLRIGLLTMLGGILGGLTTH